MLKRIPVSVQSRIQKRFVCRFPRPNSLLLLAVATLLTHCLMAGRVSLASDAENKAASSSPTSAAATDDVTPAAAVLSEANWDQLVPSGKEVDAIYGDYVLQNRFLRAVIARPVQTRNANMTVRDVGGCLIDLTIRSAESDQLSAFYPGRRIQRFSEGEIATVPVSSNASAGGADSSGSGAPSASVIVRSKDSSGNPPCTVTWSLSPDAQALTCISSWSNSTDKPITLKLEDDLRADGGKEDMVKTPDGTVDLFWFHDLFWKQAYAIRAEGFRIRCTSNPRESILIYERADGQPVTLAPGESFSLRREIFAERDLPSVLALVDESSADPRPMMLTRLRVVDAAGKPVSDARIQLSIGDQPRGTTVTGTDGLSELKLPAGELKARLQIDGQTFPEQTLTVAEQNAAIDLRAENYHPGTAVITVVDANGESIPAKVEFDGSQGTPTPSWGPETACHLVKNLAYTANGNVSVRLPAGHYDIIISHGPEYNAEFTKLEVRSGENTAKAVRLQRVVNTAGWVSADFHSHSSPSGDNTSCQMGRVLNLAAEHIEFAPCTEHNRISTYEDHIRSLKLQNHLATVSGMELTGKPLPLNHQNVFPLIMKPRTQDGGAPVTDDSPETQIERIAAWDNNSNKMIQQNHPDLGWLFYDRNGDEKPDEGYSRAFSIMNVMEIHPIDPLLHPTPFEMREGKVVGNQTAFNWLQLLNQGYRIWGVVNTDAHNNFHGSGGLRIWLKSDTDLPSEINSDQMRISANSGQVLMSNGPFLEASFREAESDAKPVSSGEDIRAASGKITGHVRVQCPNWFNVDFVTVLVNGRRRDDLTFSRDQTPDAFLDGTIQFDRQLEFSVTGDCHVIVLAGHRTERLGDIFGDSHWAKQLPAALTNPVFIDVDGDGFNASRDTLDSPLPVKFVEKK
jgi:hypothetical protein